MAETLDKRHVYAACLNIRDDESSHAVCLLELLIDKRYILYIPGNVRNNRSKDINDMLYVLAVYTVEICARQPIPFHTHRHGYGIGTGTVIIP